MPETINFSELNFSVIMPEITLVGFALLILVIDMFSSDERPVLRKILPWVALLGVIDTAYICIQQWDQPIETFQGMAISDHFALGVRLVVLIATGFSILLSMGYIPQINKQLGEYYALLLLAAVGMMMMGSVTDLIGVFLALEIFSLALYILCGIHKENPRSTEASMKYFLLGAFASAFFVYGAALVYGAAGSTQFDQIATTLASGQGDIALVYPGIALLVVGFGFKVSMVPFHMWTPDVYQGAPTPVTAFMSVGTKVAGFAAFARVLIVALPGQQASWGWALAILAVLTMTLGNLAALRQTSLKRMLAYSGIAHAGYVLVGLVPGITASTESALFYLFAYSFMNIGAFGVIIMLEKAGEGDALQNRAAGLAKRWPLLAAAMAIFMFSLTGIPPLAGFLGKLFIFKAAVEGGWAWLAVIGMFNSALSAVYYLRVVITMYLESPDAETPIARPNSGSLNWGVILTAIFTVLIGIFPSIWTSIFSSGFTSGIGG